MADMKQAILSHFNGNFESFYRKYLPNIENIGGAEWRAVCPFHQDTDPSFNFNATTGQYLCHGCGKKGDIFHFYGKMNSLATGPDFGRILNGICSDFGISKSDRARPSSPGQPRVRITATYDYHDADGKPLFQVCRKEPGKNGRSKDFTQRRPGADGQWIYNLKGVDPVLYHLPEVMKAPEVLLVEGEKDADNLLALGFTATTCPMGAGKWRSEYSMALKGKAVVLVPDNDEPGRQHMGAVAQAITGQARSIKLLQIEGLPQKGDISDFIEGFGGDADAAAERISMMIDGCPEHEPPKKEKVCFLSSMKCLEVTGEYTNMLGKESWLLKNLLIKNQITTFIAQNGAGKTAICFDYAAPAILRTFPEINIFYLDLDSPASDHPRMYAAGQSYGDRFKWHNPLTQGKDEKVVLRLLLDHIRQNTPMRDFLFFFDTLKKFCDLMGKSSVKGFYNMLRQLTALGATVVLLGHANKYRSNQGLLIPEGVGDVKSDTDALIFVERVNTIGGQYASTVVDPDKGAKVRGVYDPLSFFIESESREVSLSTEYAQPPNYLEPKKDHKISDDEIHERIKAFLRKQDGHVGQQEIVAHFHGKIGKNRVTKILAVFSVFESKTTMPDQIFYSVASFNNAHSYSISD